MALKSMLQMNNLIQTPAIPKSDTPQAGIRSMLDLPNLLKPTIQPKVQNLPTQLFQRAQKIGAIGQEAKEQPLRLLGSTQLQTGGEIAGGIGDVIGSALGALYNLSAKVGGVDEQEKENIKQLAQKVFEGSPMDQILTKYEEIGAKYPELKKHVDALANIAMVAPVGKILKIPEIAGVKFGTGKFIDVEAKIVAETAQAVDEAISKGIKPAMKGTAEQTAKYRKKASEAFNVINEYRPILTNEAGETVARLPKNRVEMLDAIGQAKKQVFSEYDLLAQETGEKGAQFNIEPVQSKLSTIESDLSYNPQIRGYATQLQIEMQELQGASPSIIQSRIQDLNSSLGAFYDGRISKAKAQVDASVASALREELDSQINTLTGANYQELKNKYGALSTIERDVARQVAVEARKANKSLIDFTDIFTGGDLLFGIIAANPAMIAKALAGRGLKEWMKYLNNPNRYIEKAFKLLEQQPVIKKQRRPPGISGLLPEGKRGFKNPTRPIDISPITPTPPTTFEPQAKIIGYPKPLVPEDLFLPPGTGEKIINEGRPIPLKGETYTEFEPQAKIIGSEKITLSDPRLTVYFNKKEAEIAQRVEAFRREAGMMATNEGAGVRQRVVKDAGGNTNFVSNDFILNRAKSDMKRRAADLKKEAEALLYDNDPEFRKMVDEQDEFIASEIPKVTKELDAYELMDLLDRKTIKNNPDYKFLPNNYDKTLSRKTEATKPIAETKKTVRTKNKGVEKVASADKALIEEAKKYKSAEEFVKAKFNEKPAYGMSHRPSWEDMPPAHNLLAGETLPKDVYQHPEWSIASGRSVKTDKSAKESWEALQKIKGKPDAEMTVYRAGRSDKLNIGDWISLSKNYANDSLEGTIEKVRSYKVKAKDVIFAGDDINEFGYYPKAQLINIWNQAHKRKLP